MLNIIIIIVYYQIYILMHSYLYVSVDAVLLHRGNIVDNIADICV